MAKMRDLLRNTTVKEVKKLLYVPYCKHTTRPGDKCPHHCPPSKAFLQWQREMKEAQARAQEYERLQDPVEKLCDAIFGSQP